ncbi:MFS transporter [Streptococcus ovuberis]|uniref:MFS transporter n=1 Tax=Streptococcus ovuberis TaxID=1936207 RepID=A0A7X6S0Z1_9STRE|nr:MFS transporter [Streptococcus ovuberis]NKZ19820.1 MFS transporter [Streptococcus ovuberis]
MRLIKSNRFYRWSLLANLLTQFGSSLYNIVFVVYVAETFQSKLLVSLSNSIIMIPVLFQLWIAQKADETRHKGKWLVRIGWLQGIFFFIVAGLTGQATLFAFAMICLMNVLTDALASYHGNLFMPMVSHQIPTDDLVTAYSGFNIVAYLCAIGGQSLGIWLLSLTHQNFTLIAILNAVSFILSSVVLFSIRKELTHDPVMLQEKGRFLKKLQQTYQLARQTFAENGGLSFVSLFASLVILNVLSSAVLPILTIFYLNHQLFTLSYADTILLMQMVGMVGALIGNARPSGFFADKSLAFILKFEVLVIVLIALAGLLRLPSITIILLYGLDAYLTGKFNPKISAFWAKHIPENQLAQVRSLISTMVMLALPVGTAIFSGLSVYSLSLTWGIFLILALFPYLIIFRNM